MCLAVPGQLIELNGEQAKVDMHGSEVEVSTVLVPEVKLGDWVLIHAGFAIQRLDEDEAMETWQLLKDLEAADAEVRQMDRDQSERDSLGDKE